MCRGEVSARIESPVAAREGARAARHSSVWPALEKIEEIIKRQEEMETRPKPKTMPQAYENTPGPEACYCVGPQGGDPLCPCRMKHVFVRSGRYVRIEDLGSVQDYAMNMVKKDA